LINERDEVFSNFSNLGCPVIVRPIEDTVEPRQADHGIVDISDRIIPKLPDATQRIDAPQPRSTCKSN
jgi:hypothetical protein